MRKYRRLFEDDDEAPQMPHLTWRFQSRMSVCEGTRGGRFQSSGFRCRGGGIPGDLLSCAECSARPHVCQQFCCFFSLSNFSHPGGFNGEFA